MPSHRMRPSTAVLRRLLLLVLVVTATAGTIAAEAEAPSPAAKAVPVRATFGIQPAGPRGPDTRPYLLYPVAPGAVVQDHAAVVNYSSKPLTLRVYVTDAFNAADGSFSLLERAKVPTLAGTWLHLALPKGQQFITVAPKSYKILSLRLSVPSKANPGDHVAGIVAALSTTSKNAQGTSVELDQRVGVRTFVRVSGKLKPALSIEHMSRHYHGVLNPFASGMTTIEFTVRNTGNVSMGGVQRVRVKGLLGPTFKGLPVPDLPLLLPGGSVELSAKVPHTWPLIWMSGRVEISPAVVKGVSSGDVGQFEADGHFLAIPWTLLALIVALVTAVVWRRRRRALPPRGEGLTGARSRKVAAVRATAGPGADDIGPVLLGAFALVLVSVFAGSGTASAGDALSYNDPAVTGTIGLCDVHGKNVMSGKVADKPFVWRSVGTTAAKDGYDAPGRTAFLTAFQPRQGVDPGNWSGYQLAAAARYTNPKHPMSQSTPLSSPLTAFLERYPPGWDGLVQLRLLLGGSQRSPQLDKYDATDIAVKDGAWRVVRGGKGPCDAGSATSVSVLLNVPGAKGTPKPVSQRATGSSAPSSGATGIGAPRPSGSSRAAVVNGSAPASSGRAGVAGGSLTALAIGGLGTALIALLAGVWAVRRRATA